MNSSCSLGLDKNEWGRTLGGKELISFIFGLYSEREGKQFEEGKVKLVHVCTKGLGRK